MDEATAEDICQDVVERALRSTEVFATADNLRRWATVVALNEATDLDRMRRRHLAPEAPPDTASPFDMEAVVTHRLALSETASAMAWLRPEERAALVQTLSPESGPLDRRTQNRENIRRLRARARLRGLVRNFPAVLPARWTGWLRRQTVVLPDVGPLAAAGLSIALALASGSTPAGTSSPPIAMHTTLPSSPAFIEGPNSVPTRITNAADTTPARTSREARASEPTNTAGRTTLVAVADPTGGTRAGVSENSDKPIACVVTEATPSLCVPNPVPRDAVPAPSAP